ncbi:hypothetical protein A2U01_0064483, partial [Trifolium medium]|nr:hypothetical protein [Trifolium medium]
IIGVGWGVGGGDSMVGGGVGGLSESESSSAIRRKKRPLHLCWGVVWEWVTVGCLRMTEED